MPTMLIVFSFFSTLLLSLGWLFWQQQNNNVALPNHRSSHATATPQGGGLAMAIVGIISLWFLSAELSLAERLLTVFPFLLATITGYLDDFHGLSGRWKLALIILAVLPLVFIPLLFFGALFSSIVTLLAALGTWAIAVFWVVMLLGLVWVVNLTNFMDGINGLAALEVLFILGTLWWLRDDFSLSTIMIQWIVCLWVACLSFLPFNFPKALLFLGDTGSLFFGVLMAWIVVVMMVNHPNGLWVFLCLFAMFWVDATLTLIRRLLRQKSIFEAHREHAYQHLANEKWQSHTKATLFIMLINVVWLLPMAYAVLQSAYPLLWLLIAIIPVIIYTLYLQAGMAYFTKK